MKMKWLTLTFTALLFLATVMAVSSWAADQSSATAQTRPMMQCQQRFASMDANHDGEGTKEEFMAGTQHGPNAEQVFDSMAQGKGYITQEEFCANKGRHGHGGMGKGGKQ